MASNLEALTFTPTTSQGMIFIVVVFGHGCSVDVGMLVCQMVCQLSVHLFGPDWNISMTCEWNSVKSCEDIHDHLWFRVKCLWMLTFMVFVNFADIHI